MGFQAMGMAPSMVAGTPAEGLVQAGACIAYTWGPSTATMMQWLGVGGVGLGLG